MTIVLVTLSILAVVAALLLASRIRTGEASRSWPQLPRAAVVDLKRSAKILKTVALATLLVYFATPVPASPDEVPKKAREALMLIGEDEDFLDGLERILAGFVADGRMGADFAADMRSEFSADDYLKELAGFYAERVSSDELEAVVGYLGLPENRALYRDLIKAHAQLSGSALEVRQRDLQARNPEAWSEAERFFRSPVAQKISQFRADSAPIKRKCSIAALVSAQAAVQDRRKKEPNQPPQRKPGSRPSSGDSPAPENPSSLGPRG